MSNRPRSRKKHMVEGTVAAVEKMEEVARKEKVGENTGFLRKMIRRIKRVRGHEYR